MWINTTREEVKAFVAAMGETDNPAIAAVLKAAKDAIKPLTTDEQYFYDRAWDAYHRDGETEIDDGETVSLSDDDGAYVLAWIWVPDDREHEPEDALDEDEEEYDRTAC